jgi:hypothetical protein
VCVCVWGGCRSIYRTYAECEACTCGQPQQPAPAQGPIVKLKHTDFSSNDEDDARKIQLLQGFIDWGWGNVTVLIDKAPFACDAMVVEKLWRRKWFEEFCLGRNKPITALKECIGGKYGCDCQLH